MDVLIIVGVLGGWAAIVAGVFIIVKKSRKPRK